MMDMELVSKLANPGDSKLVLLVYDGLGGVDNNGRGTALEAARIPNLDALAKESITGFHNPIGHGITPGSGPAHLSIFGYDPLRFTIGRGVLEALGVNFPLHEGDVPARINFCTVDANGVITDRRAGRIPSEEGARVVQKLADAIQIKDAEVYLRHVKEYRAAVVLRGTGLGGEVADTDPQVVGKMTLAPAPLKDTPENQKTASIFADFLKQAREILKDEPKANMLTLRGVDLYVPLPSFQNLYHLNPTSIAVYPMYKGVSRLAGMKVQEHGQDTVADEFGILEKVWNEHDFFFVHVKKTDSYGEDGNFEGRIKVLEEVDPLISRLRALNPDVIAVTGDHSTPSPLKSHSWHPVPLMIYSRHCRADQVQAFNESALVAGGLGTIHGTEILPLMLANGLRLSKFGA
jgi:2,3-bisphosphoglycerate-independent phosphoglycerate mutase